MGLKDTWVNLLWVSKSNGWEVKWWLKIKDSAILVLLVVVDNGWKSIGDKDSAILVLQIVADIADLRYCLIPEQFAQQRLWGDGEESEHSLFGTTSWVETDIF